MIHITADYEKTLCGIKANNTNSSTMGTFCTCEECFKIANKFLLKELEKQQ